MKNLREEVLSKIDIVEEMQNYVELEKSGQNYKCICPFHDDTDPSLTVSEQKQIFKCFVCEEGGTIIEFVQKFEKISPSEALNKLAKKIGIKIKEVPRSENNLILDHINLFYEKILLNSDYGLEAKEYLLKTREIDEDIINKFKLGYSPKYSTILYEYIVEYINSSNISILNLEKLNIFSEKNYDLLNNRITFPLYDEYDRIVGFSGRVIEGDIKYLNSKQSEVFNKSKILYNLNNVIKNKIDDLIIVEGFFDVITAYKYNINNVVATMGVAFTSNHIKLLKKYKIKKIYLGFDSDKAGQRTTNETARILIENGFDVKIITYENAKDIDEYLKENKVTEEYIKSKAEEYLLYTLKQINVDTMTLDEKSKVINQICSLLKYYKQDSKKDLLIEEIASILKIDKNIIIKQIPQIIKKEEEKIEVKSENKIVKTDLVTIKEKLLLYIIANDYEKFLQLEECIREGKFEFWLYLKDYEKIKVLYQEEEKIEYVTLLDELEFYYEIDKDIKEKYGTVNFTSINIYKYLNDDKKKSKLKYKKLEELNKGR